MKFILIIYFSVVCNVSLQITNTNVVNHHHSNKKYYLYSLPNEMNVLYIRNVHSTTNSVSLVVNSGVKNEFIDIEGLAHLTEHMLFLGSKDYPEPSSFINYITLNEGTFNGYTELDKTVFYYKIPSRKFKESLIQFSSVFKAPLFNNKYIHKEINSVNNEHEKNIQNDSHRKELIIHSLANKHSLYHRFSTGNTQTLAVSNIRDKIIKYFNNNYLPQRMFIIIYGPQEHSVIKHYLYNTFNTIEHKGNYVDDPNWNVKPFMQHETSLMVLYETIHNHQEMEIRFIIEPCDMRNGATNSELFFMKMFNYKGTNSLSDVLVNKGLIKDIKSSVIKINMNVRFLIIKVRLTDNGLISITHVIKMIFAYINSLKIKMLNKKLFNVFKRYCYNNFYNKHMKLKGLKLIKLIAQNAFYYNKEYLLIGNGLLGKYNKTAISEFMQQLNINNCIITIGNKTFTNDSSIYNEIVNGYHSDLTEVEKYSFTKYNVFNISNSFKDTINSVGNSNSSYTVDFPEMNLNKIVPQNANLLKQCLQTNHNVQSYYKCIHQYKNDETHLTPKKLHINGIKAYFTKDRSFLINKTNFICKFTFPYANIYDISFISYIRLYIFALYYKLRNYFFIESLKGNSFKIQTNNNGYTIELQSYSTYIQNTIQSLLHQIYSLTISLNEFNLIKDDMIIQLQSQQNEPPIMQTHLIFQEIIQTFHININDIINYIKTHITYELFNAFMKGSNLYNNETYGLKVTTFVHGSLNEQVAMEINEDIITQFKLNTNALNEQHRTFNNCNSNSSKIKHFNLNNKSYVYRTTLNNTAFNVNNAIANYYEIGDNTSENFIKIQLIKKICGYIYFTELRIKQQLGYITKGNVYSKNEHLYFVIQIQGSRKTPFEMDKRIELLLQHKMRNKVKNVSINKLNILKSHILKRFKVKDKSLLQRTKRLWNEIKTGNDITANYNNVKEYIHNIHKEDLLSFFDDVFIVNKGKLSVQIYNNISSLQNENNINNKDIIVSDTNYFRNLNHTVIV